MAQANAGGMALDEYLLSLVEVAAGFSENRRTAGPVTGHLDRRGAVEQMLVFGEKHRLSYGEPITRAVSHEGHRFLWPNRQFLICTSYFQAT
jgi:hypothetical protein